MIKALRTERFARWLEHLSDLHARSRIEIRLRRLASGNPGNSRPVGGGGSALRLDYGPGYRVQHLKRGAEVIVLLAGGDKSTQASDSRLAQQMARSFSG